MSSYAKFLKEIISNKRELKEHETGKLIEECSVGFQSKHPVKHKDPSSFPLP